MQGTGLVLSPFKACLNSATQGSHSRGTAWVWSVWDLEQDLRGLLSWVNRRKPGYACTLLLTPLIGWSWLQLWCFVHVLCLLTEPSPASSLVLAGCRDAGGGSTGSTSLACRQWEYFDISGVRRSGWVSGPCEAFSFFFFFKRLSSV